MAYTAIDKPSEHFSVTLYTGDGNYPRAVTGIGFQPDFVWLKNRDVAYWHQLYDAVRGAGSTAGAGVVYSNQAAGFDDTYRLTSFDSDGFTLPSALSAKNDSGNNIVAFCWKGANGTASNTDGDFTTTVSANQTAGFSVLTGTSDAASERNVGHGLGKIPDVVFARNLEAGYNWDVWFKTTGYTSTLQFNNTSTGRTGFGSGTNSTTTFSTKDDFSSKNGVKYLYYCFTSIKGFSKISQYIGNGQADGPFVYTGFKPAMVITKRSDSTSDWRIWDHKRDPVNAVDRILYPSAANAEGAETYGDFLSNGFKPTVTTSDYNAAGGVYQYLAFADNPFVTSTGVPTLAY